MQQSALLMLTSSSTAHNATHYSIRLSGHTVALKIYQPDKLHEISQFQLLREARLHTHLNHPNVVRLYAAFQQVTRGGHQAHLLQRAAPPSCLLIVKKLLKPRSLEAFNSWSCPAVQMAD